MDVRHWQKSFLKKLFPTLNYRRNGNIWSLRETFPFMKMLFLEVLKGGIKGFNKCNLLFIAAQSWSYFEVKWGCAVGKCYPKSLPIKQICPRAVFQGSVLKWEG